MSHRVLRQIGGEGGRNGMGARKKPFFAGEQEQGDEVGHHRGVGVGRGVVLGATQPDDKVGSVVGGQRIAAGVGHPVVPLERGAPALGGGQKGVLVGGLEQAQRRPDHVGIVVGGGLGLGLAGAVA